VNSPANWPTPLRRQRRHVTKPRKPCLPMTVRRTRKQRRQKSFREAGRGGRFYRVLLSDLFRHAEHREQIAGRKPGWPIPASITSGVAGISVLQARSIRHSQIRIASIFSSGPHLCRAPGLRAYLCRPCTWRDPVQRPPCLPQVLRIWWCLSFEQRNSAHP
jgi:hypothetical protein